MWVAAFIGMATSFAECSLAQLYKERDANGQFRGGPAWYMARGLGCAGWAFCSPSFCSSPTA
ncbi:alanine:cation symporter family protein [Escherichia coli]